MPSTLWIIDGIGIAIFASVVFWLWHWIRQGKMIRVIIEARGGKVLTNQDIAFNHRRIATYIDDDGMIQEGMFRTYWNHVVLIEDWPIEETIRGRFNQVSINSKLIGKDKSPEKIHYVRELMSFPPLQAAGALMHKIADSPDDSFEFSDGTLEKEGIQLGGVIQGLRLLSFGSEDKPLEINARGGKLSLTWSVTGERPNRVLQIKLDKIEPQSSERLPDQSK